jgi:hypothetical protein
MSSRHAGLEPLYPCPLFLVSVDGDVVDVGGAGVVRGSKPP